MIYFWYLFIFVRFNDTLVQPVITWAIQVDYLIGTHTLSKTMTMNVKFNNKQMIKNA